MADRQFQQVNYSLEKNIVRLYAVVSMTSSTTPVLQKWNPPPPGSGSVGTYSAAATSNPAATLRSNGWQGINSVTRVSTGVWTFQMQDAYQRLLQIGMNATNSTGSPVAFAPAWWTTTNVQSNSAPFIKISLLSATNTPADPSTGDLLFFAFELQNSTAV